MKYAPGGHGKVGSKGSGENGNNDGRLTKMGSETFSKRIQHHRNDDHLKRVVYLHLFQEMPGTILRKFDDSRQRPVICQEGKDQEATLRSEVT
jgi:hypothetical protein